MTLSEHPVLTAFMFLGMNIIYVFGKDHIRRWLHNTGTITKPFTRTELVLIQSFAAEIGAQVYWLPKNEPFHKQGYFIEYRPGRWPLRLDDLVEDADRPDTITLVETVIECLEKKEDLDPLVVECWKAKHLYL